jgi:hypothetical protein
MCAGYVAGGNTQFFGERNGSFTVENIQSDINDRLSFNDEGSGEFKSMLAFAVPYGSSDRRDQVMSLSARLLPWEVTPDRQHTYFPGGPKHYDYYARMYKLDAVHFGEDMRASENMEFISQVSVKCCQMLPTFELLPTAPVIRGSTPCVFHTQKKQFHWCRHRAQSTTRCASSARTVCTRRGRAPSLSSRLARATLAPTPSPE